MKPTEAVPDFYSTSSLSFSTACNAAHLTTVVLQGNTTFTQDMERPSPKMRSQRRSQTGCR